MGGRNNASLTEPVAARRASISNERMTMTVAALLSCWLVSGPSVASPAGVGPPAASGSPAARAITIEQAVAEALAHHPRIRVARDEENVAAARVSEARSRELPALGVS